MLKSHFHSLCASLCLTLQRIALINGTEVPSRDRINFTKKFTQTKFWRPLLLLHAAGPPTALSSARTNASLKLNLWGLQNVRIILICFSLFPTTRVRCGGR